MKRKSKVPTIAAPLRRRAETRLREWEKRHHSANGVAPLPADARRLLHELQVYQIELELQNEELRKTRDEMEAGLETYTELYDFAPVGYLTLDRAGAIREANLTAASLLGITRAPLLKLCLGVFVATADRPRFNVFLRQVFAGMRSTECDVKLLVKGKPQAGVRLRANLFESGDACRVAVTDITLHNVAEEKVRVSESRYRRLFEAAHDGVLLLDPDTCKITDANPFMTTLLDYERDQLLGKELFEIGLLKDKAASQEMFRKLKIEHEVRYEDLPLESQQGRHQEVEVVANLYQEGGRAVIQCNIRDITDRKRAEAALRRSEARYRSLFDSIDEGFCIIEKVDGKAGRLPDFRYLEANPAFTTQSGMGGMIGKTIRQVLPAEPEGWCRIYSDVLKTGKPIRFERGLVSHGRVLELFAFRIEDETHRRVAVLFKDITARKQVEAALREAQVRLAHHSVQLEKAVAERTTELKSANAELGTSVDSLRQSEEQYRVLLAESRDMQKALRQLTHQMISVQEEERKAISRELHDGIVQTLIGINVELSALTRETSAGRHRQTAKIARAQRLVANSVQAVHRFARELRPAVLDDLGLIPALHSFCKNLTERKNLKIQLTVFAGIEALGDAERTVLFRVAQEALHNVVRHARATQVKVILTQHSDEIQMVIKDNGKSFSVEDFLGTKNPKRLGLVGMKERVEMVRGSLTLESAPGSGTTVRVIIPFNDRPTKIKK